MCMTKNTNHGVCFRVKRWVEGSSESGKHVPYYQSKREYGAYAHEGALGNHRGTQHELEGAAGWGDAWGGGLMSLGGVLINCYEQTSKRVGGD